MKNRSTVLIVGFFLGAWHADVILGAAGRWIAVTAALLLLALLYWLEAPKK